MSDQRHVFVVGAGDANRLDKFLVACLPQHSRSRLQGLVHDGFVTVNGEAVEKAGMLCQPGDRVEVRIPPSQPSGLQPEPIPLDVVFEDGSLMVINKPAGMVVHPAVGHPSGTLVQAALAHAPQLEGIGGEQRPGVVHRLDKETSGLIIMAKNDRTHRWLQDQFRLRHVKKVYIALVDGFLPTPQGRVEAPIGRDPRSRKKMAVVPIEKGREAVSEYFTRETFAAHTLVEVHPLTGRTHQIRLHMAFLGCPVAGDTIYGRKKPSVALGRHFLHAAQISIQLPGDTQARTFTAPLPAELLDVLIELRSRSHKETVK